MKRQKAKGGEGERKREGEGGANERERGGKHGERERERGSGTERENAHVCVHARDWTVER